MNKSNFFNISRATSTIEVEGIGEVHCRELSAGTMGLLQKENIGSPGSSEMAQLAIVLIGGVVDDKGKPMFTNADRPKLLEMTMKPLQVISDEILKLTGLTNDDEGEEIPNE